MVLAEPVPQEPPSKCKSKANKKPPTEKVSHTHSVLFIYVLVKIRIYESILHCIYIHIHICVCLCVGMFTNRIAEAPNVKPLVVLLVKKM